MFFAFVLAGMLLFSGCLEPDTCGDGVCDTSIGENDIACSMDCPSFHLGCVNGTCSVVEGTGSDQCTLDSDCT